jgi:single-stranded DNA-binding protein
MGDRVTVSGTVEASPRVIVTDGGLVVASFRLRARIDGCDRIHLPPGATAGCYLVTALDDLARGVALQVRRGDVVVVGGTLALRESSERSHVVAEVHAEAIGLDVRGAPSSRTREPRASRLNLS